jgi:hypothetical protein
VPALALRVCAGDRLSSLASLLRRRGTYAQLYRWLVLLALLDILFTTIVLSFGGAEANALARAVIDLAGLPGMIFLKIVSVTTVLAVCEVVGRRRHCTGRLLAHAAIVANSIAASLGCAAIAIYEITVICGC